MYCLNRIIGLIVCLFIMGFATSSEACDLNLESNPQSSNYEYSSQSRSASPQKIILRVRNTSSEKCVEFLNVQAQGRENYLSAGSQSLTFRIYGGSNNSLLLFNSNANIQNTIPIIVDAQASVSLELFLVIDRFQNAMAGTYVSDLDVHFGPNEFERVQSFPLRLEARIKPNIQANITGLGTASISNATTSRRRNSLKLGELIPKKNYRLGLQIRSNTPVSIRVDSDNKGSLRHQSEQTELPYAIELNGQLLQMKQSARIDGLSTIYKDGRTNPINIRLSDFGDKLPAGNYSDILTFHISAR